MGYEWFWCTRFEPWTELGVDPMKWLQFQLTVRICLNEFDVMPYVTFEWVEIDFNNINIVEHFIVLMLQPQNLCKILSTKSIRRIPQHYTICTILAIQTECYSIRLNFVRTACHVHRTTDGASNVKLQILPYKIRSASIQTLFLGRCYC